MIAVRYYTRSGNTKKLASAVARAVKVGEKTVMEDLPGKTDLLFLGCSVYAGRFHPAVGEFLVRNVEKIGTIVLFGTSASGQTVKKRMKKLLETTDVKVLDEEFSCPGRFLFLHKSRPDQDDLKAAAAFAKRVKETCGQG
ncbi:MAG: flavodoxin [Clostridia bacterium]|nr:flavodoxin [Clostridia bacterium]